MRMAIGAAGLALALASAMAAQPALAWDGAAPVIGGSAPLYGAAAVTPAVTTAAVPALASIGPALATSLTTLPAPVPAASAYRLASVSLPATAPASPGTGDEDVAGLRRRFPNSSMMDLYPLAGSGLHLSGGTRLFARRNFVQETADSARGALAVTRSIMAPMTTRAGFKKFNPALTAGYTVALSRLAQIGVEGGALMSNAFAGTPGLPRQTFGYRGEHDFRPDAIANMVFGLRF